MSNLKKNVAGQNVTFGMVTTSGAADAAATVTVYVVKDNGVQATGTGTVTNSGHGQYNYAPTQAETNAVCVGLVFTASGDVPVFYNFLTDVVDANGLASVNVADIGGSASVGAAGSVGIDWAHVANPTTSVALTNTTLAGVTIATGGITTASYAPFAESYTVLGTTSTYTLPNLLFDIHRELYARSVSGTTETILKMDGATTAHTITLNSATAPTSAIQAT